MKEEVKDKEEKKEKQKDKEKEKDKGIIEHIYNLRDKFLIIGLTGRTGSGCTTVADILSLNDDIDDLKSAHSNFRNAQITNQARKDRIVYEFMSKNWNRFTKITASDIIYYYAFQLNFDGFSQLVDNYLKGALESEKSDTPAATLEKYQGNQDNGNQNVNTLLSPLKANYDSLSSKLQDINKVMADEDEFRTKINEGTWVEETYDTLMQELPELRREVEKALSVHKGLVPKMLQNLGNNIRRFGSVDVKDPESEIKIAPIKLAEVINHIIKIIRRRNGEGKTWIVIDALRNPFEILYFRERYAAFYCMSVNTETKIRHEYLLKCRNLNYEDIKKIDEEENEKKETEASFTRIDLNKCIEISDIHLYHDGVPAERNEKLVNQLLTYIALILHPGLVTPTPIERMMQVAFTAKLNSGCLSRQVGAAVTGADFSLKSIGWNSVPQGQVPCSLRQATDLWQQEDDEAFSEFEKRDDKFQGRQKQLKESYVSRNYPKKLWGLPLTYCFKDIYTNIVDKQRYNQVHTRSLHAEENAFLQISRYGGVGLEGGKLFTTANCCELCAKKAYQLGIKEIYYIDAYPGISELHILNSGDKDKRPKSILFHGAVGRAYVNLYNPFMPRKDEVEELTGVKVTEVNRQGNNNKLNKKKDGGNNKN